MFPFNSSFSSYNSLSERNPTAEPPSSSYGLPSNRRLPLQATLNQSAYLPGYSVHRNGEPDQFRRPPSRITLNSAIRSASSLPVCKTLSSFGLGENETLRPFPQERGRSLFSSQKRRASEDLIFPGNAFETPASFAVRTQVPQGLRPAVAHSSRQTPSSSIWSRKDPVASSSSWIPDVSANEGFSSGRRNETGTVFSSGMQTASASQSCFTPKSGNNREGNSVSWGRNGPGVGNQSATTPHSTTSHSTRTCVEALDANSILAIVEGRGHARGEVGMACFNTHTSNLILCQFTDTQTYTKVIAKVNIFRPCEILMPNTCCEGGGTPSQLYLQLRKEVSNIPVVAIQRQVFNEGNGLQRIKMLVVDQFSPVIHLVTQKYYCLASGAAVLKYVELVQSILFVPNSMKIEFQGSEKTCMIDNITAQHLELLQNSHQPVSSLSLLGILSGCRTPGGSRLIRMDILQPPCDLILIQRRLDCVEELIDNREALHGLQDILGRLPVDIEHFIATLVQVPKLDNIRLTEQRINHIIALKHTLEILPTFVTVLASTRNDFLQSIREDLMAPVFNSMLEKIQRVINDEAEVQKGPANMKRQRCFAVKADINPILDIARKAYCEIINDMNEYIVELSHSMKMAFRLGQNSKRGFYVQLILSGRGDQMPKLPSSFLQVRKDKNVVTFTTELLVRSDQRSQEISKEIESLSAIVVAELVNTIREDIGSIYRISEAVANLDVLYALANYSLTTVRCVRPKFSDNTTAITMGRHPVLDSVGSVPPVPNNTFLSTDSNFAIITGPNMSGKTTYLKQVATLQILSQLGSFVPAESATFRITSNIFSRIGTGDNIEGNASSFMLEMTEMSYILGNVNNTSLVIIDELGRATSVEEGTGMSWAIAEALLSTKAFVLFATHYLFLTKLQRYYYNCLTYNLETQELKKVQNGDEVENDLLSPRVPEETSPFGSSKLNYTHVLKRGVTDVQFYGLKLASNSSFPSKIVEKASQIAATIVETRKDGMLDAKEDESNDYENKSAKYLLASHLRILAEDSNITDPDVARTYLESLREEFLTSRNNFGIERLSVSDENSQELEESENRSVESMDDSWLVEPLSLSESDRSQVSQDQT